jgi:hypothetical protein
MIQNKVEPGIARLLLWELEKEFSPFAMTATSLSVWRYLEGPWELLAEYNFPQYRI